MKCLLLVLSAVLLPFCGFAGRFAPNPVSERRCITASEMRILFSDGVPQFEIVIPRNAPPAAKFAAEELAKHLGKVLGCQLEILNEKSGKKPALIVGDAALALKNGMDVSKLDRDGFFIRSIGDDVLIVGSDSPQRISTWTERATLFAVYDFLERFAGVRFYFPGETGTVTPRVKEWKLPVRLILWSVPIFNTGECLRSICPASAAGRSVSSGMRMFRNRWNGIDWRRCATACRRAISRIATGWWRSA